jgi:putative transposase
MCRLLKVSMGGLYAWRRSGLSNRARDDIRPSHRSRRFTGTRTHVRRTARACGAASPRHAGCAHRVARLMRAAALCGVIRRGFITTTQGDTRMQSAEDLVRRNFQAAAPDRLWLGDITFVPTCAGSMYLAIVLDVFSRHIVEWAMENLLRTECAAGDRATFAQRHPREVIHHFDHGTTSRSLSVSAARNWTFLPRWNEAAPQATNYYAPIPIILRS